MDGEAFEALCEKLTRDTDNDGVIDRYAMMSFSSHLIPAALVSNGAGFVQVDENGKYYNAAETDAFLEAMNWVMDMVSKYEMKAPEGAEWNYFESAFINGEVALQVHEDYFAGSLANMEDDYGFVFFPKGPRAETYLYAPSDNIMVIPACYDADRAWKIAFAYNLFTNPTPGYTDSDDWKNGYYQKYRDERAVYETITMKINVATGKICIAGQFMYRKDHNPVILCLDLTTHQRNIGIIILAFKSFSFQWKLFSSPLCRYRLSSDCLAVHSLHTRMVLRDHLILHHRLYRLYRPVIHGSIRPHQRFFIKVAVKIVIIITVFSVYRLCSLRN